MTEGTTVVLCDSARNKGFLAHMCMAAAAVAARGHAVGLAVTTDDSIFHWWTALRRRDLDRPMLRRAELYKPMSLGTCPNPPPDPLKVFVPWQCSPVFGALGLDRLVRAGTFDRAERELGKANADAADSARAAWHAHKHPGEPLPPLLPPGAPLVYGQVDTLYVPARLTDRLAELLAATADEGSMVEIAVPTVLTYMVPHDAFARPARCNYLWLKRRANFSQYWTPEFDWFHPMKLSHSAVAAFFNASVRAFGWHTQIDMDSQATQGRLQAIQTGDC